MKVDFFYYLLNIFNFTIWFVIYDDLFSFYENETKKISFHFLSLSLSLDSLHLLPCYPHGGGTVTRGESVPGRCNSFPIWSSLFLSSNMSTCFTKRVCILFSRKCATTKIFASWKKKRKSEKQKWEKYIIGFILYYFKLRNIQGKKKGRNILY